MLTARRPDIEELAGWQNGWCVSAFVPSHDPGETDTGDLLRLKNLLRAAEQELVELGERSPSAAEVVAAAVPAELVDPTSELSRRAGFAVFAASGLSRSYRVSLPVPEFSTVGRRFHLRPLLRELDRNHRFFLLALTRGYARLYAGSADRLEEVEADGLPSSLEDATRYDDRERSLQSHGAARSGRGNVVAAFHGQGDRSDHLAEDVARYLRRVDAAIGRSLEEGDLLVLAGSVDVLAQFRELSTHRRMAPRDISGNPEIVPKTELHREAFRIADDLVPRSDADELAEFRRLHGTGLASTAVDRIVAAASQGRVGVLWAASDTAHWGRFREDRFESHDQREAGDEDLLDRAAIDAWGMGATVHVVPRAEMPEKAEIAAIFRY